MENNFRILEKIYTDEYGISKTQYFYVKRKKSFLGITYWRSIKHEECGYGDCYNVITTFKTAEEAKEFIRKLCQKVQPEKWESKVVLETNCTQL